MRSSPTRPPLLHNSVIITGHRALTHSPLPTLLLHSLFSTPSLFSQCASQSLLLSQSLSARLQPAFTREQTLQENPLRPAPPLSVSYRPHSFMTPISDVGDSTVPTAVGNDKVLEYIWDTGSHQPAHSQSLRLGNQGISGDSRLYFAVLG